MKANVCECQAGMRRVELDDGGRGPHEDRTKICSAVGKGHQAYEGTSFFGRRWQERISEGVVVERGDLSWAKTSVDIVRAATATACERAALEGH